MDTEINSRRNENDNKRMGKRILIRHMKNKYTFIATGESMPHRIATEDEYAIASFDNASGRQLSMKQRYILEGKQIPVELDKG